MVASWLRVLGSSSCRVVVVRYHFTFVPFRTGHAMAFLHDVNNLMLLAVFVPVIVGVV